MAFLIDIIYVVRELTRLMVVVITSPFAILASMLTLGSMHWQL